MLRDFILTVSFIHLASLRTKLVILRPVLLGTHTMKMAHSLLVASSKEVHTLLFVIVHMKCVNRVPRSTHCGGMPFKILRKSFVDLHGVGTGDIIRDIDVDTVGGYKV